MQRLMLVLTCVGFASVAGAQVVPMPFDPVDFEAKMTAAMGSANKSGDANLGCDAIQKELVATVNDPAVQASVARQGAVAQQQIAKLNDASAATSGNAAAQMAMGLASALRPAMGGGVPVGAGLPVPGAATATIQAAQMRGLQAQAAVNQQLVMTQMQEMVKILPQLMRSQRLVELAANRKCGWAPVLGPPAR
jgi:hypothetical protein